MDKKTILIIILIVGIVIGGFFIIKSNKEKVLEEKQVSEVVKEVSKTKMFTFKSGYDIEDIQARMDKKAGKNKTIVYREQDEVYIQFINSKRIYRVNDYDFIKH